MMSVEEILKLINNGVIKFNLDDFEATDTEGHTMEGIVEYNGKHYVVLSFMNEKSYKEQIAEQIYDDFLKV